MRLIIIILLFATGLQAQIKSTIILGPGEGGPISGPADSMGLVVPLGEIVIGTGSKAPGSSDSLLWNAGLYVDAPVIFSGLPNLAPNVGDSLLMIAAGGAIGKTPYGANFFTANGTATGNRSHDFDNFNLSISDIANFTITANTNWQFGTTANDIRITAITGLGMNIQTTGSNLIAINSSTDLYLDATNDIILDAPDIILEDALTLITADTILVRNNVTGEIQGRLASTIAGSDSLGRNGTAGQIVFETATKAPNSSANLFWNNGSTRLGIGTNNPQRPLQLNYTGSNGIRMQADAAGYMDIQMSTSLGSFTTSAVGGDGNAAVDFNPNPANGTGQAFFRAFRSTNTTGAAYFDVLLGNNTSTVNARIAGKGTNTFFAANNGRVAIGHTAPATSAILDVSSTTGAVLLPRMTTTQRDALTGVNGMQIYNSTTNKFQGYAGGAWVDLH